MIAQKLLDKAYMKYKVKYPRKSISQLAKDMDLAYSTVYNPLFERRKCSAETWIKMMEHFGAIEIKGAKILLDDQ